MQAYGPGTDIGTSRTFVLSAGLSRELTGSSAFAGRLCTSYTQDEEDEPYSDDDDESLDDYFDLDELGIDPEEFYELCPNSFSLKL